MRAAVQGRRRILVLRSAGVAFAAFAALPAHAAAGALTPDSPVSAGAEDTRTAYIVMVVLATLIAAAVIVGLLAAVRRRTHTAAPERRVRGTSGIQWRIGIGLGAIATIVFVFGVLVTESAKQVAPTGADGLRTAQLGLDLPDDAEPLEIRVSGQQWLWRYEYPDETFSYYELVVPVDTAVVLEVGSTDVLHSWWVPALGGMFEVAPGSDNRTWFKAEETGVYEGRSTVFSGPGYPTMRARVRVVEAAEYEAWIRQQTADIQEAEEAVREEVEATLAEAEGEDARAATPEPTADGGEGQQ
jgi:cytochrome c oxidase subunit II